MFEQNIQEYMWRWEDTLIGLGFSRKNESSGSIVSYVGEVYHTINLDETDDEIYNPTG